MKAAVLCLALSARIWLAASSSASAGRGIFLRHKLQLITPSNATVAAPATATSDVDAAITDALNDDQAVAADAGPSVPDAMAIEPAPTLPAVATMMGSAAETLKGINSQASILEARIAQTQMENEAKMARQKAVFEHKLLLQDQKNKNVAATNTNISGEIELLKRGNTDLKKQAMSLQEENKFKRNVFSTLKSKLGTVGDFISESLKATDDRDAQELAVLQAPGAVHHAVVKKPFAALVKKQRKQQAAKIEQKENNTQDDSDDDSDDSDEDDEGDSFVALRTTVRRTSQEDIEAMEAVQEDTEDAFALPTQAQPMIPANPRDLLKVLSSGIDSLSQQEKASEAQLKSLFLASFRAGSKKHAALIATQRSLNSTRASLTVTQQKLQKAVVHLEDTKQHLDQRLHKVGEFLQKFAGFAMSPTKEALELAKNSQDGNFLQTGDQDANADASEFATGDI